MRGFDGVYRRGGLLALVADGIPVVGRGGRVGGVPLYPATGWRLGVAVVAMEGGDRAG